MKATTGTNPDHNIWNNNGTWWCHFTVHHSDYTKERVRVSLGTKDREQARRQRDFIMRGTASIAARLPHRQAPAMPDIRTSVSESRAVIIKDHLVDFTQSPLTKRQTHSEVRARVAAT
jgi:hypothetical protein